MDPISFNRPRILFVTPEVSFVPACSGKNCDYLKCKSRGFAGFLSRLVGDLYERGADVHIAQPDYRRIFSVILQNNSHMKGCRLPQSRVHLTEDRVFFYTRVPESNPIRENIKISLAFQREIIYQILPLVQPDLIHCHDWMCGLIPAVARRSGIPCIFTLQGCETARSALSAVEDIGIDAALFWQNLFFDRFPVNYEETRETNSVDFLLSGIFAAHHASIASTVALAKIVESLIRFPAAPLGKLLSEKLAVDYIAVTDYHSAKMQYIDLYERLLRRSLLRPNVKKSGIPAEFPPVFKSIDLDRRKHV
ncbi:MAG: glycogen/starch synthase [Desulfobacterales bacterium]